MKKYELKPLWWLFPWPGVIGDNRELNRLSELLDEQKDRAKKAEDELASLKTAPQPSKDLLGMRPKDGFIIRKPHYDVFDHGDHWLLVRKTCLNYRGEVIDGVTKSKPAYVRTPREAKKYAKKKGGRK